MVEEAPKKEEQVQEIDESKYERDFAILVDLEIVSLTPDPDDNYYDYPAKYHFCPNYDDA